MKVILIICLLVLCGLASSKLGKSFLTTKRGGIAKFSSKLLVLRGGAEKTKNTKKINKKNATNKSKLSKKDSKQGRKAGGGNRQQDLEETNTALSSSHSDNDDSTNEEEDADLDLENPEPNRSTNFIMDIIQKTPPLTRFYLLSCVSATLLCFCLNSNKWPEILTFSWKKTFLHLQV